MTARICVTDILKSLGKVFSICEEVVGIAKWLTLRKSVFVNSVVYWDLLTPEGKGHCCFKTSGSYNQSVQCHIPEGWNPQLHHCQDVRTCFGKFSSNLFLARIAVRLLLYVRLGTCFPRRHIVPSFV